MAANVETTSKLQGIVGILLLLTLLYWSRRHVLGRGASWVLGLLTGQRVRIQQISLQPLTLSGIEVATTDGVHLQLSRLQVDVHLRAFLASFGQGKLLRLFLDDIILTASPNPSPLSPPARSKRRSAKSTSALVGLMKFTQIHVKSLALRGMLARDDGDGFVGGLGLVRDLDVRIADATSATTSIAVVISHAELSVVAKMLPTPSLDAISERPSLVVQANQLQYTIELDYVQLLPQRIAVQGPPATDPSATVVLHAALLAYVSAMAPLPTTAPRSAQPPISFQLDTIALQLTFVHGPDDTPTELSVRALVDALRVTKQIESSGAELTLEATVRSGSVRLGDVTCLLWRSMTARVHQRLTDEMETIEMTSDVGELSVHWSARLRMLTDATEKAYQRTKSSSLRPKVPLVLVVTLRCGQATLEAVDADKAIKLQLATVHMTVAKTVDQSRVQLEVQDGTWRLVAQNELLQLGTTALQLLVTEVLAPNKSMVVDMTTAALEATLLGLPLAQLTGLRVVSTEAGDDIQQIQIGVESAVLHWVFALHAARLVACSDALLILLWVQTIVAPPKPHKEQTQQKKPLHLVLESNDMGVHMTEIPHIGACASKIAQLHVHVQSGSTRVQVQQLLLRHGTASVLECSDLHLVDTKPTATSAASHLQVDLTSVSLVLGTHFRLLALVLQLQDLMAPPRRDKSLPPPLKLDVNIRNILVTVLDVHETPACRLQASQYHVKATLTPSSSATLSDDHAALVRNLDTVLSFDVYRPLLARLVVIDFEMDTGSIDIALGSANDDRVAHLQLRSLTLGGRLLDMAGGFASSDARAPAKRLGVSLHIAGHGIALHATRPEAAVSVVSYVSSTLVYAFDTAVLEAMDVPRGNPRLKFFGEVDVSATDVVLRYTLSDAITAALRVAQLQVVCDKTYRIDGHLTQLSIGLPSDILLLARVSVVAHCLLDDRDRLCDTWSISVAASIRALHEADCNGLLLEWSSVLAALRTLAFRPSTPLDPPPVAPRFHRIATLALQVTIAPLQMAWWEDAITNDAFLVQAETLDVTLRLVEEKGVWTLPTCRIAAAGTRAYELATREAKAGPIPFLRGPLSSFFLEANVLEYAKSTLPYIPIHVDECKLLWTIALRDHVCRVIDLVHRDVLGLRTDKGSSAPIMAAAVVLPETVTPLSLLELLEQGKLGSRVSDAAPATTNAHETRDLVKLYQLDIEHVQINVLEPDTKSSLVLASRLIHLEWGYDAAGVRSMADVQLKEMRCLVAPLDVDIGAGILWYKEAASSLLRPILTECSLQVQYAMTLHNQATRIRVHLPSLELTVDSHQFFQCFSVVKHVLLAPPVTKKSVPDASPRAATKGGKRLQQTIADELRRRDLRSPSPSTALKSVAFEIGLARCRLRTSPEDGNIEFVALELHQARGSHVFYDSLSTKFNLSLQWLEIQNLRPGASSMTFDDPMAVLTPRLATPQDVQPLLSLRAESVPLVGKDVPPLRVFEVLEVSFFPGVAYDFAIQLAVDFYELMFTFFFGATRTTESFGKKSAGSRPPMFVNGVSSLHPDNDDDVDGDDLDVGNEEVVFFNYVRVGNICLHIACSGFVVNLSGLGLDLPPFVCRSKLCTWKRLLRKFEVHLAWCVSKESASSGLHHVKKKFFARTKKTDKTTKDDDTRRMLFGPYHPEMQNDTTESS